MVGQRERKTRSREAAYYDCCRSDAAWLLVSEEWIEDDDDDTAVDITDGVVGADAKPVGVDAEV